MDPAITIKLYETLKDKFDKETADLLIAYIDTYIEERINTKINKEFGLKAFDRP